MSFSNWLQVLRRSWRLLFGFLVPILLCPLLLDYDDKSSLCAYVLLLMVLFWMFEPINIYMTSLFPMTLFPLLGITTTDQACMQYMKSANVMFFGGLIVGIALEYCNLHRRIALKVILLFGSSIKALMAGVMLVTLFLSMWISNTATTAMMLPIVDSILLEINRGPAQGSVEMESTNKKETTIAVVDENGNHTDGTEQAIASNTPDIKNDPKLKVVRKALLLSIAYSANIGGTATLTGTGTNLVFSEVFNSKFPTSHAISFTSWFIYAFPAALVTMIAAWCLLYFFYARLQKESPETGQRIRELTQKSYDALGPFTFHEYGVMVHFIILVLLWFFRDPVIYPGWAQLITSDKAQIKDSVPVILISISMFLFPANLSQFVSKERPKEIKRLLSWNVIQTHMSWGVFFLLGGGFALAFGTEHSKLTDWFSDQLSKFAMDAFPTAFILVLLSASITEVASNVATANVVLPVISQLAVHMNVNPLYFLVPVTISISFAFMFPVATPPNAIVFEYMGISVIEMVKPGIVMNLLAIGIQLLFINTVGRAIFDLDHFPEWAASNSTKLLDPSFLVSAGR